MMEAWASVAGMETLAGELLDVLNSPKCTGDGKADGIGWLAKRVGFASMIWGSACVCVCVCVMSRRMASTGWPREWVLRL